MKIITLRNDSFRNLSQLDISPHEQCNILVGAHGSGKTSLLESIYFLLNGKSFRESIGGNLIQRNQDQCTVFAVIKEYDVTRNIGIQKTCHNTSVKLNGSRIKSISEIARVFPIQPIHPESQRIINGGPSDRRKFLDWGVFHVEHTYAGLYREFRKVLKQRNSALQQKLNKQQVSAWDCNFVELAMGIHACEKNILATYFSMYENYSPNYPSFKG